MKPDEAVARVRVVICKDPNKLCPCVRGRYLSLREIAKAEGLNLLLIETLRTPERQRELVAAGTSWTRKSKHLPQHPHGLALAFDIAIEDYIHTKHWNPAGPLWQDLGRIALGLGLEWGVWRRGANIDPGHIYLAACACDEATTS
jgi:hypothetical protein